MKVCKVCGESTITNNYDTCPDERCSTIVELYSTIDTLKADNASFKTRIDELEKAHSNACKNTLATRAENAELKDIVYSKGLRIADLTNDLSRAKAKLAKRNKLIRFLRAEIEGLKQGCKVAARRISQDMADDPAAKTDRPDIFAKLDKLTQ